jgi:putative transposase
VRDNQTIAIEDLHIHGMIRNHCLARAISDAGWHEFRRQLTYKCVRYRRTLVAAHGFYPSSKLCSQCGHHQADLTWKDRMYLCPQCGLRMDRDINAAINLRTLARRGSNARGELTALVTAGCLPDQPARRIVNPGVRKNRAKNKLGGNLCPIAGV